MNSISVKILSLFRNHGSCVTQQEVKLQNIHFQISLINSLITAASSQISLFVNISPPSSEFVWVHMFPSFEWEYFWGVVSILLQIRPKKCPLKLLTEHILLKKHKSVFIWIQITTALSVIVKNSLLGMYFLNVSVDLCFGLKCHDFYKC